MKMKMTNDSIKFYKTKNHYETEKNGKINMNKNFYAKFYSRNIELTKGN